MLPSHSGLPRHTRVPRAIVVALIAGSVLAGCSPSEQQASAGSSVEEGASAPASSTGATIGGDGSQIRLDELTESDVQGAGLSGELACSFSTGNTPPILLATGVVASNAPAEGIVKVSGHVERIGAPGGFNGITDNPTFTGQGKTIEIAITGPATEGGESPPRPATLTYQRADGASRIFDGHWQCGP